MQPSSPPLGTDVSGVTSFRSSFSHWAWVVVFGILGGLLLLFCFCCLWFLRLRHRAKAAKGTAEVPTVPVSVSLESAGTGSSHIELDMGGVQSPPPPQAPSALSADEESFPVHRCSIVDGMSAPSLLASESSREMMIEIPRTVLQTESLSAVSGLPSGVWVKFPRAVAVLGK